MFFGAFMGTGTKKLCIVLFFSRILHMGWVLSSNSSFYFIIYCIIIAPVILGKNVSILILNIAGLPPLRGFIMKITVLQGIACGLCVIMLFFSLVILFCYI